ncbi:MAG: Alkaline phosphatase synthesis transcriptional regulatory protein PhoP, partial [Planctomycetota bacterium]
MTMQQQQNAARILVVDDEAHIVQVVALKFRNAGLEVDTAGDGDEALAMLEGGRYDLVVTDLQMPAMSGIELARAMASRPAL